MTPVEVAEGVFLLALPLGIHRIPSINAYLFADPAGDTLIDCGIYAGVPLSAGEVDDGTGASARHWPNAAARSTTSAG